MSKHGEPNQSISDGQDEIIFGKHKGYTFDQVLMGEPQYLNWAAENDVIIFSDDLLAHIENAISRR